MPIKRHQTACKGSNLHILQPKCCQCVDQAQDPILSMAEIQKIIKSHFQQVSNIRTLKRKEWEPRNRDIWVMSLEILLKLLGSNGQILLFRKKKKGSSHFVDYFKLLNEADILWNACLRRVWFQLPSPLEQGRAGPGMQGHTSGMASMYHEQLGVMPRSGS